MVSKPSVVIGDAQYLSRTGLRQILATSSKYSVVGEVRNHEELETILQKETIDLVILDYNQSGFFGTESVSLIKEVSPFTHVLIISDDNDRKRIYEVVERGVNSFITKLCGRDEIHKAIESTMRGEKFFCSKVLNLILERSFGNKERERKSPLTEREKEILTLIAQGHIAREISEILNISTHTIYTHRKNIMRKLDIHSPVELIMYAVNNDLVDLSSSKT